MQVADSVLLTPKSEPLLFCPSCFRGGNVTTSSFCMPSLAPPFLPWHNLEPLLKSVQKPHKPWATRKLFPATPAQRAQQLHCFPYVAIHHMCAFHDSGLCFLNWIWAPTKQLHLQVLLKEPWGPLSVPFTLSPHFLFSLLPPILVHSKHREKRPNIGRVFSPLPPPRIQHVWSVGMCSVVPRCHGRTLPLDPQNLTILCRKLVTSQHPIFGFCIFGTPSWSFPQSFCNDHSTSLGGSLCHFPSRLSEEIRIYSEKHLHKTKLLSGSVSVGGSSLVGSKSFRHLSDPFYLLPLRDLALHPSSFPLSTERNLILLMTDFRSVMVVYSQETQVRSWVCYSQPEIPCKLQASQGYTSRPCNTKL